MGTVAHYYHGFLAFSEAKRIMLLLPYGCNCWLASSVGIPVRMIRQMVISTVGPANRGTPSVERLVRYRDEFAGGQQLGYS